MKIGNFSGAATRLLSLCLLLGAFPASADDAAYAEALVRGEYFEGIPYEEAAAVGPAGAARLVELLGDPSEIEHHAAILEVLGICAQPGAYEAVEAYAASRPVGAVSGATWRAQLAIPIGMGHLSRVDPRALRYLIHAIDAREPASWTYRSMGSAAVGVAVYRRAIVGLGLSGAPQAEAVLRRLPARPPVATAGMGAFSDVRSQVHEALELRSRIAGEGPAAVLAAPHPETD
jgi:hypothetical protein